MLASLLINILLFVIITFTLVTLIFLYSVKRKNKAIIDITYGSIFVIGVWTTLLVSENFSPLTLLIATYITIWSLRFSIRRWHHYQTTADHQASEKDFLVSNYLRNYVYRGMIMTLIALPFIITVSVQTSQGDWYTIIGTGFVLLGFTYNSLMYLFKRKSLSPETPAVVNNRTPQRYYGLPYFDETIIWFGLALIAYPLPYGNLSILSVLIIFYLVTHSST